MTYTQAPILVRRLVAGLIVSLLAGASAQAKLIDIMLGDLVRQSNLIAYGESVGASPDGTRSVVIFKPLQTLKGRAAVGGLIQLCNEPDTESHDLKAISGTYIVFASYTRGCYRPVHGISSVILVEGQTARTLTIADQPEAQAIHAFLAKIRETCEQQRKKNPQ